MPVTPITDWGTAVMTALTGALAMVVAAIPLVIGFLVILIVGWIIAGIVGGILAALLRAIRFNDLAQRSGLTGFVRDMGLQHDPAGVVAEIAKWFVRLIVLVVAFNELGLTAVSQVFNQMLAWLPNLVVALVVLVITGILANAAADLVRGSTAEAGLGNPRMLSTVAKVAIWGFGIIVALDQIGIAATLVNTLFMAFVGAIALAIGLSFGLGGRDTASEIVRNWYGRAQASGPRLRRATDAAQRQANAMAQGNGGNEEQRRAA